MNKSTETELILFQHIKKMKTKSKTKQNGGGGGGLKKAKEKNIINKLDSI